MDKIKVYVLGIAIAIALGLLCSEYRANSSLRKELRDLSVQLAESEQKADTFYIRDSIPVFRERVVELDRTDYKKQLSDASLIRDLKLKVSVLESENRLLLSTRDTVFLRSDDVSDTLLRYSDKWVDFEYVEPLRELRYAVRDSVSTFVSGEYRHKFLWWRWGLKGWSVTTVSHNPHCKVSYSKFIKIK